MSNSQGRNLGCLVGFGITFYLICSFFSFTFIHCQTIIIFYRYPGVNTQFGILALPTILLFHNSKPVSKFNHTIFNLDNYAEFLNILTGIEPTLPLEIIETDLVRYNTCKLDRSLPRTVTIRITNTCSI